MKCYNILITIKEDITVKKILSIIVAMCIMLSVCAMPAMAEEAIEATQVQTKDVITIMVDGKYVDCSVYGQLPVIVEGRTLVPLRSVFEALGATVEWNDAERSVTSVKGDVTITLAVNSNEMVVNAAIKTLDVPACIMNDRTMVPVRAVAEAFGCKVEWNNDTRTVVITTEPAGEEAVEVVLEMWTKLIAGDFEAAKAYCAEGAEIEGLTDLETMVEEALVGELDLSAFTVEQAAKIEAATAKLVKTFLGSMKLEIEKTEAVSETEVLVHTLLSAPDFEALDTDSLVTEELLMVLMLDVMAEKGISLDALTNMNEQAQADLGVEVGIKLIEYLGEAIEANVDMLPMLEAEPTSLRLKLIDGKWLIIE